MTIMHSDPQRTRSIYGTVSTDTWLPRCPSNDILNGTDPPAETVLASTPTAFLSDSRDRGATNPCDSEG